MTPIYFCQLLNSRQRYRYSLLQNVLIYRASYIASELRFSLR